MDQRRKERNKREKQKGRNIPSRPRQTGNDQQDYNITVDERL